MEIKFKLYFKENFAEEFRSLVSLVEPDSMRVHELIDRKLGTTAVNFMIQFTNFSQMIERCPGSIIEIQALMPSQIRRFCRNHHKIDYLRLLRWTMTRVFNLKKYRKGKYIVLGAINVVRMTPLPEETAVVPCAVKIFPKSMRVRQPVSLPGICRGLHS